MFEDLVVSLNALEAKQEGRGLHSFPDRIRQGTVLGRNLSQETDVLIRRSSQGKETIWVRKEKMGAAAGASA